MSLNSPPKSAVSENMLAIYVNNCFRECKFLNFIHEKEQKTIPLERPQIVCIVHCTLYIVQSWHGHEAYNLLFLFPAQRDLGEGIAAINVSPVRNFGLLAPRKAKNASDTICAAIMGMTGQPDSSCLSAPDYKLRA